jgi:hypothetical protein
MFYFLGIYRIGGIQMPNEMALHVPKIPEMWFYHSLPFRIWPSGFASVTKQSNSVQRMKKGKMAHSRGL